jgi:glycosyltransferase involved in cell wall biosynthesis
MVYDMIYERFPDLFGEEGDERFRQWKRRCVMRADLVVCNSETTRRDVQAWYGIEEARIRLVSRGCSEPFRANGTGSPSSGPTGRDFLLYVGTRYPYKNFGTLLRAYRAWPSGRDVDLVVVGGGAWTSEEERDVSAAGLGGRVRLLPDVTDARLCELYRSAVCLVFPSLYEGFGLPLLEAMSCGCPIVASRIPSTVEVAGDCPIYFEPRSVDDLVRALEVPLVEGRGAARCRWGLERAPRWSWDRAVRELLDVYREVS